MGLELVWKGCPPQGARLCHARILERLYLKYFNVLFVFKVPVNILDSEPIKKLRMIFPNNKQLRIATEVFVVGTPNKDLEPGLTMRIPYKDPS